MRDGRSVSGGRWRRGQALTLGAALACGLAAAPLGAPVRAQPADPAAAPSPGILSFTQTGVTAEATAENGVLAKERALVAGRRAAWERLVSQAGVAGPTLSDRQIEDMVASIVIEQERANQSRYTGRITVNFNPGRARAALGQGGGGGGVAGVPAGGTPIPTGPASVWIEATAVYRSLPEWLALRQRLAGAAQVANVDIVAIAVDGARLRLGLRLPAAQTAAELAALGIAMQPAGGGYGPGENWRVTLGGG